MAPESLLSLSTSLFSLPHKFNKILSLKTIIHKPQSKSNIPIIAKSTNSQTPTPTAEIDGTGAAKPTRGDLFLSRQQAMAAAAAVVFSTNTKDNKKPKKKQRVTSNAVASCFGCGAPLHTLEVNAPGFVELGLYELKKKHRQLGTVLCGRCKLLSHGHMVTAVGGNGGYPGGKQFVSAEELRRKLSHLKDEKALIVKLVDIVDFNGSFLAHVRDFAGANPIILVVTKVDLLPKGTDLNCVGDWVVEATTKKKLNVLSVHLTSSKSMVGIAGVASEIQKEKKGSANVGKSAFISALLKLMAQKDPVAATARKYKPIQSAVPGTTLGPIQINAFLGDGKLYDTPGVHLHHRQAAVVHSEDLPALAPQNRLRGQSFPVEASILGGFSIFWGGLVRIDALKVLTSTRLTFYGPKALQLHIVPTAEADDFYKKQLGVLLTPPTGKKRADEWAGLQIIRQVQIKSENHQRSACDIAISGLGWIAVEQVETSGSEKSDETSRELLFAVHVPKPVEIFVRAPLPVGKNGGERYEYRELTEIEEELRPKWYF